MIPLTVTMNLDIDPWTDLHDDAAQVIDYGGDTAKLTRVGILPNGTRSGKATVGLLVELPDGRKVIAETTLALFLMAARACGASPIAQMEDM